MLSFILKKEYMILFFNLYSKGVKSFSIVDMAFSKKVHICTVFLRIDVNISKHLHKKYLDDLD